ncbi:hypothetical protein CONCODRAFT_49209 [Conidiobolus coronatus NRRL 28638]|uniref:Pre-mRNA-splicing factor CWC26 n=1 Tax=Conidiobolus coronatus (strain ATCC 28846 / CBS 209.66 / NRRL 28638) TaxID=796925 RepID=A0A137P7K6_CONC2|nr:hypothetical protein CONCODRAFT_49209 [Conidiobolus coronatus NRRL 28638]|eukprot:KXN70924.1 hypothetical protein CONCODRAFT_49209 [Conidiobolus coronatus NRRL 28638]
MSVDKKYLLSKYGSIESSLKPSKKKKSKNNKRATIIDEDGDDFWQRDNDDELEGAITVDAAPLAPKFKSKKESNWTKIQGESSDEEQAQEEQQYGLISGDKFSQQMRSKEKSIKKQMSKVSNEDSGQNSETVYRDKFGKKIDMDVEKKKSEAIELAQKMNIENQKQFNRGVAQREMEQQRYLELMDQKNQSMTVYKDDKQLNETLRTQSRWEDPSARYIKTSSKSSAKSKYPQYSGPYPSNRFNIAPGYRWDGVDRSNGFEKEIIKAQYARNNLKSEAYAWGAEDM